MRSTDERLAAVKQRTNELKKEKIMRKSRIISLTSIVACLMLVIGVAFEMPEFMENLKPDRYVQINGFASIFSNGGSVGYVFIALLAFALGVCVTFLCIQLQHSNKEDKTNGGSN